MAELVFLDDVDRDENTVLTVGTFDGVHKGHQALINTVVQKAEEQKARSMIVTFDPHPREILNPGDSGIKLLTTLEERCQRMEAHGVDVMLVIPFDRDFSLKSSTEFVEHIIHQKIGVKEFVIGYDHHFGKDREGSIETVENLGQKLNFNTYVVSKKEVADITVSSTKIRNILLKEGDVTKASRLLGWKYTFSGIVEHGQGRGKKIGFPTANLRPLKNNKAIPKVGVYAVKSMIDDRQWDGMMNIGFRPTFKESKEKSLEVHIFDFNKKIYGKKITVEFVKRMRGETTFKNSEELINQLEKDKKIAQNILK